MTMSIDLSALCDFAVANVLRIGGFVLLSSFLPILIFIAIKLKIRGSRGRLEAIEKMYDLSNDRYFEINLISAKLRVTSRSYFPVIVITALCLFFSVLLMLTDFVARPNSVFPHFLLSGHEYRIYETTDYEAHNHLFSREEYSYEMGTLTVMGFAFMGWYAWSIHTIFSRLVTMELVPGTLYVVLSRLVLAIIVSIFIRHAWGTFGSTRYPEMLGFASGMFPTAVYQAIKDRFRKWLQEPRYVGELPVEIITGISPYRSLRLYEMGIDDCANLAAGNPIEIFEATNLPLLEIIDWIGQAQLVILVGSVNFRKLQSVGIRTILDFVRMNADEAFPPDLKDASGRPLTPGQLACMRAGAKENPSFRRLCGLRCRIQESDALGRVTA
jgi:hypothetical protein